MRRFEHVREQSVGINGSAKPQCAYTHPIVAESRARRGTRVSSRVKLGGSRTHPETGAGADRQSMRGAEPQSGAVRVWLGSEAGSCGITIHDRYGHGQGRGEWGGHRKRGKRQKSLKAWHITPALPRAEHARHAGQRLEGTDDETTTTIPKVDDSACRALAACIRRHMRGHADDSIDSQIAVPPS